MTTICPPALIYIVFSLTQIIIDLIKGLYNTAFMKFIVMSIIGFLLNILCQGGLGIISWIIVFIPFMLMTIITAMLLYAFGLNDTTGSFIKPPQNTPEQPSTPTPIPLPTPPPQMIDPRCFILQTSIPQQQKHGMKSGSIIDNVYCPWMQDAQ
jgi:hypothetical protein